MVRNGEQFRVYGPKVVASREPLSDGALLSRGVIISLLPTNDDLPPLNDAEMARIRDEFQGKLLTYRGTNFQAVSSSRIASDLLRDLTPARSRSLARLHSRCLGMEHLRGFSWHCGRRTKMRALNDLSSPSGW